MGRKLLTPLSVENLKPRATRFEVADAGMAGSGAGLYLIVQPSGNKSWALRFRYGGRSKKLTLGLHPAIDLGQARSRARAAIEALDRGEDPAAAKLELTAQQHAPRADPECFGVLIRRWFEAHCMTRQRSWRETGRLIGLRVVENDDGSSRTFTETSGGIVARWSERPIHGIRRRDVRELLEASKLRGASTTANRELSALKTFFNWCVDQEILELNPAARVAKPAPENRRTRVLSDAEIALVWRAATIEHFPFGPFTRLLLLTGQRRGEVAGLRWREIDIGRRVWLLPKERAKNFRPHAIPLSESAIALIEALPRFSGGDFVFGRDGLTSLSGFSKGKARLDKRVTELAGEEVEIPEWNLHDLRRTCATTMGRLAIQPVVIEATLNHVTGVRSSIASIYNMYSYLDEKADALERWAAHVAAVVEAGDTAPASNVVALKSGARDEA
jgi:integrase